MRSLREAIRSIIKDDALYRRLDLPGDVDDPPEQGDCGHDCECEDCKDEEEDFVTPKYALYTLIGDAIDVYDSMENDDTGNEEVDEIIVSAAKLLRSIRS